MVLIVLTFPCTVQSLATGRTTFLHQQLRVNTCNYHVSSSGYAFGLLQQA